ncbi:hypothetical protein HDV05_002337 [Chytridiales sp. JEL 0842]|nr:hypothetical protein HDV05_002337 [Chytridiales sp. JEL 0842]
MKFFATYLVALTSLMVSLVAAQPGETLIALDCTYTDKYNVPNSQLRYAGWWPSVRESQNGSWPKHMVYLAYGLFQWDQVPVKEFWPGNKIEFRIQKQTVPGTPAGYAENGFRRFACKKDNNRLVFRGTTRAYEADSTGVNGPYQVACTAAYYCQ